MSGRHKRLVGKRIADRYCITGEIGKGGMGVVYRAIPFEEPSQSVAIKVIQRSGRLGYEDLMRFQKEASLMSQLHHPNIVVFHELGLFGRGDREEDDDLGSGYYIVMEIADGTNLKESLARDGRKDLSFLFQVGLQVSAALDYTHGKGIIHRDIKPHNIIVGQTFRDQRSVLVKVLDFGVARLAEAINYGVVKDAFQTRVHGIDEAAGTPLYMAPEQTRFMDAPIDHRVDLYSLGCVLYELLTGKPPFSASTRERLERQHVYSDPEPVSYLRPDVPILIEKIVHKLLAKHPSDRYQTAFGLHADLMRAKSLFDKKNVASSASFPLGLKDRFQAVSAQLKMIGRQKEYQTLVGEFDGVIREQGRSRLALVKGIAGIGKSRLLHEFQTYLARRKVKFITAQFSQHENNLPFNALANGFNEYLHRTMKANSHEAQEIRQRVRQTLGPTAHKIAEIVPGLKPYILDIPEDDIEISSSDAESLNQTESFATFAKAFSDFTRCLGTNNQPIAFIFHDLHWADEKSLDLIDVFFSNANANAMGFFLLVSQRTDAHLSNPRCDKFLEKFSKLKRRFTRIELDRINKDSVAEIVGNMLMSKGSVSKDLVNYLEDQSRGNPMHLVELTRTLVARNYISIKSFGGDWEYDMTAVRTAQIRLNTVDLILSRMGEYDEFEQKILRIAATVGISFQFEIILLEGKTSSVPAINAIQKAMEEGLIVRVTDDKELKHLGKTYMFTHKKARDAIYESMDIEVRRKLHRTIGEKIESAIPNPRGKVLFSLAHHFNAATENGTTADLELAKRNLKYNRLAGSAAKLMGSWQTAERYFENADRMMNLWKEKIATHLDQAEVKEILGDLASLQKRHGQALKVYRELLNESLPLEKQAVIAYKAIYFQIIGGIIGESEQLIKQFLKKLKYRTEDFGFLARLKAVFRILIERFGYKSALRQYLAILGLAIARSKKFKEEDLEIKYPIIRLLSLAQLIELNENKNNAIGYHEKVLIEARKGRGSANSLIRFVAERGAILGLDGGTKISYRLLDAAMQAAKELKLRYTYGYICLIRALTIDYIKGRQEEVSHHLNDALAILKSAHDDRLAYSHAMVFKIFRESMRCNFPGVYRSCQLIPEIVPSRSSLAPRAMALMLFGYLLQGSRSHVVRHGEMFVKRRQAVSGRENDIFVKIVNTIIAFARGEVEKTREAFVGFLNSFHRNQNSGYLFPYEFEFVGIFSFIFPLLYEHEYGRKILRDDEREVFLKGFRKLIKRSPAKSGAVSQLLMAKTDELLGRRRHIRSGFDAALKGAKESGNNLVQILAYLWFGTHLVDLGNRNRKEFLRRAFIMSQKCEMVSIVLLIRKVLEKRKIYLPEIALADDLLLTQKGSENSVSISQGNVPLNMLHLQFVSEAIQSDTSLISNLDSSIKILQKFYNFDRVRSLAQNHQNNLVIVYPKISDGDERSKKLDQEIVAYVEPYFNLKSTLFVPFDDAPWNSRQGTQTSMILERNQNAENSGFDAEATFVIATVEGDVDQSSSTSSLSQKEQASRALLKKNNSSPDEDIQYSSFSRQDKMLMSALVPIRSNGRCLGVLFMENVAQSLGRDTTYSRLELDHFGAQLGVLFERKKGFFAESSASKKIHQTDIEIKGYESGQYSLEPVPWLKLWHSGRLRAQRETVWYLGLNFGSDHYVLCYVHMAGIEEIREKFGAMVWNHLFVLRTLAQSSSKRRLDMNDFYDEFVSFFKYIPKVAHLESISIALSIFSRREQSVSSGHFGPARPYVLGVENLVTPSNDIVMTYFNGRDLRYWEVEASLGSPHAYVLSYDTSRLDSVPQEPSRKKLSQYLERSYSPDELHRTLANVVENGLLPRYYLGAVMIHAEEKKSDPEIGKIDKAQ